MFSQFAKRAIAAFERRYGYDASYMREILDAGGIGAMAPLHSLSKVGRYKRGVPFSVYYAAKITASIAADCGACAQLQVKMAEEDAVDATVLRALVDGNRAALGIEEQLGFDLARATVSREDATGVRSEIVRRYGMRGLTSLAYGVAAAGAFPTIKYALGYGYACTRLDLSA